MAVQRLDNVGIVVEDLDAAIAFFGELGLQLVGRMPVEGDWVDRTIGLDGVQADIASMRTPDGSGQIELSKFRRPKAVGAEQAAPANALGIRRIMFTVDDIDDTIARLKTRGATVVRDVVQYENAYRLCYLRGPEGILVALAEELG